MKIILTLELAHAIVDMDDIAYSEGLGPENNERFEAWHELVEYSEVAAGRLSDKNKGIK